MKKIFLTSALAVSMILLSNSASAQSDNDQSLIAKACSAIKQNCDKTGPMDGNVETLGICFVDGFIKRVTVIGKVHCIGNGPCTALPVLYGHVDFGCDGEIVEVVCN